MRMKNGSATGLGDIPIELIKSGDQKLLEMITTLLNKIINGEKVPEEWKVAAITSIHKKGDKRKCENYTGISVTNTFSRIYGRIFTKFVEAEYKNMEMEEQSGFRAGRSCIDNIFCLTQMTERKRATNRDLCLLFTGLTKTYDSVPLNKLWEILDKSTINARLIEAIKSLYNGSSSKIKIGNQTMKGFKISKGLRQGCSLSPTLFKIYLERVLRNWKRKCEPMGIPIQNTCVYSLNFADDQVLLAQDHGDMEYMARKLKEEYEEWGLTINLEKTKYVCIGGEKEALKFDCREEINPRTECTYLGTKIDQLGDNTTAIKHRISQIRKAINALNSIWWHKNITKNRKLYIFQGIIHSILTYGAEVWQIPTREMNEIISTEMDVDKEGCKKIKGEKNKK
jgi:hypothetical protein